MVARLKTVKGEYIVRLPTEAGRQLAPEGTAGPVDVDVTVESGSVVLRPADTHQKRVRETAQKVMDDFDSACKRLAK